MAGLRLAIASSRDCVRWLLSSIKTLVA